MSIQTRLQGVGIVRKINSFGTMEWTIAAVFVLINCAIVFESEAHDCKDENNNSIDWFYIYKLPRNKFSKNPLITQGVAYLYITPQSIKNGWTLSNKSINDSCSIPGLTFSPLYQKEDEHIAIIYNDQPFVEKDASGESEATTKSSKKPKPDRRKSVRRRSVQRQSSLAEERRKKKLRNTGDGHTKGVILGDNSNGIWVIHSVPRYPPVPEKNSIDVVKYSYPDTARKYGQSFLCMSLKSSSLNVVGQQLSYNEPKILYSQVPQKWQSKFSKIVDVVDNKTVFEPPWSNIANLTTKGGARFLSFAKSGNFKDDLYKGLVGKSLKSDLYVESWVNGPGVLDSNCTSQYKVYKIEKIAFQDKAIAFSSHADHSKWAISAPATKKSKKGPKQWICVGDINRAETQELRGGGTVCTQNNDLWKYYSEAINEIEPCKKPSNRTE